MSAITQHTAEGLSYLTREGGKRMPIVLLHGIGSNAHSFEPLMQTLADDRTLAWDAPGYRASRMLTARCILLGHSLGALMAARFARVSPKRVAALVLASPALGHAAEKGGALPASVAQSAP